MCIHMYIYIYIYIHIVHRTQLVDRKLQAVSVAPRSHSNYYYRSVLLFRPQGFVLL